MKKALLVAIIGVFAISANAGDWGGKAPKAPKAPIIVGCPDTNGYVTVGYESDYIYRGYRFNQDTVVAGVGYTFESVVPITVSATHYASTGRRQLGGVFGGGFLLGLEDVTEVGVSALVASAGGVDVTLGYTHRFYTGLGVANGGTSSSGEIGLGLSKDLGFATAHFDLFYNLNQPNSLNVTAPGVTDDNGSWYWDLGLDKSIGITDNVSLVLGAGVAYADNYWGGLPGAQTGGRASGWNHYYLRASFPIELNCAATLTPYIGYIGAPDGFLMDGALGGGSSPGIPAAGRARPAIPGRQSDILHAGVSLTVKF